MPILVMIVLQLEMVSLYLLHTLVILNFMHPHISFIFVKCYMFHLCHLVFYLFIVSAKIMMLLFILMHLSSKSRIYVRGNFFTVASVNVDSILSVVPFYHPRLLHPMPFPVLHLLNYGTLGLAIHSLESLVMS
jgi:hypothetical protein